MVGLPAYLLGKQGVRDAMFLPETLIVHFCSIVQYFKRKLIIFVLTYIPIPPPKPTQKDNFHNLTFVLTKEHYPDCIFSDSPGLLGVGHEMEFSEDANIQAP